jgi:outer membrane protein OmpA-like peptidoglycan-associated protein
VSAQQANSPGDAVVTVTGTLPTDLSTLAKGPELDGFISARHGDQLQVTSPDGTNTVVTVGQATQVRGSGGFLGLNRDKLSTDALINGLPVAVQTVRWGQGLGASRVQLKSKDLQTASMIRNGTEQRFGEHGAAIQQNAAATEALRGRLGDIDQYNIKHTTNVNFAVDKATLSPQAKNDLCATAAEAEGIDNALLLVVGYTDSTGDQAYNQQLSEKRAGGVVNYLQQACHWKPYRMLTPTGMSEADPLASNDTAEGKAQNRRVAVNIMVSKSVDGL